jgi:hypothetical protein
MQPPRPRADGLSVRNYQQMETDAPYPDQRDPLRPRSTDVFETSIPSAAEIRAFQEATQESWDALIRVKESMLSELARAHREFGRGVASLQSALVEGALRWHDAIQSEASLYVAVAQRYKWFVPGDLPFDAVTELNAIVRDGGQVGANIRHFFVNGFRIDDWTPLVHFVENLRYNPALGKGRYRTLRDCADVMRRHGENRFNAAAVIIPALISIIDGLLIEFARQDLEMRARPLGTHGYMQVRDALANPGDSPLRLDEPATALAFGVLFETAYPGKVPAHGMGFNRHKILHGESLTYGTAANALRAFFVVDFVARSIAAVRAAHDSV